MLKSIQIEIEDRRGFFNNKKISSIYFGGGTPSILSNKEIEIIIKKIYKNFLVNNNAEITIECNPDDLKTNKLLSYIKLGINRLSIGVQSFNDQQLKFMNRSHNSKEAINCIKLAKEVGFKNITIDLIYGIPNQKQIDWQNNLERM